MPPTPSPPTSRGTPSSHGRDSTHGTPTRDWINENGKRVQRPSSSGAPVERGVAAFDPDASVVIAGLRGAGKSTLAIIASTAMKRRIADAEKAFQQATGFSSSTYKKLYGVQECDQRQAETLSEILTHYSCGAVIVCSWMGRGVQALLQKFSLRHPVIYVIRDAEAICHHLKLGDLSKAKKLLSVGSLAFRSCTNYEFFNLSETPTDGGATDGVLTGRCPAPYLTLKRAERHFLKFLSLVMPSGSIPFIESAFPLASIPTEKRSFTYAVSVRLSSFMAGDDDDASIDLDIEELETGADAIELVIDDLDHLNSQDFDKGEGRLEPERAIRITRTIGLIRRSTVVPIIYHVVAPGGLSGPDSAARHCYLEYVEHGLRLSSEYVTLDLSLPDQQLSTVLASRGRSKVVGHCSWRSGGDEDIGTRVPGWSDPKWTQNYRRVQSLGFDLGRFLRPAAEIGDNSQAQQFRVAMASLDGPPVPLIAYNTRRLGRQSACFNPILTSVAPEGRTGTKTPRGRRSGRVLESDLRSSTTDDVLRDPTSSGGDVEPSDPCITAFQATKALYSSFHFDPLELYVFGANVGYSLSPAMHNAALRACGVPHRYRPVSTDSLAQIKGLVFSPDFGGASVGLPFKVEIISIVDALSAHARAIGAVNTLIPIRHRGWCRGSSSRMDDAQTIDPETLFADANRHGRPSGLYGENTDWIGIRACIRRGLSPANAVRPSSCGLVIGAGGMARAAVYAMLQLGLRDIAIFNRTRAHAQELVEHFMGIISGGGLPVLNAAPPSTVKPLAMSPRFHIIDAPSDPWPESFRLPTIIISCIPTHAIGDAPPPNFTVPEDWLGSPTGGVVVELAYKTLNTPLLDQARRQTPRGWVTMDGLDLLPEQGFAQFELFTGRRAPRRLMRREVFRAYPPDEQGQYNLEQLQPRLRNIVEQEP
ncbi:hypothetical protein OQA88_9322 [Cercophora sp. LCS_1]